MHYPKIFSLKQLDLKLLLLDSIVFTTKQCSFIVLFLSLTADCVLVAFERFRAFLWTGQGIYLDVLRHGRRMERGQRRVNDP